MKKKIIIGALVICLLAFVAVFAFSQSGSNVRWEYRLLRYGSSMEEFNSLGAEGWEFVGTRSHDNLGNIFKRRLP